jgi:hypothetical protein
VLTRIRADKEAPDDAGALSVSKCRENSVLRDDRSNEEPKSPVQGSFNQAAGLNLQFCNDRSAAVGLCSWVKSQFYQGR